MAWHMVGTLIHKILMNYSTFKIGKFNPKYKSNIRESGFTWIIRISVWALTPYQAYQVHIIKYLVFRTLIWFKCEFFAMYNVFLYTCYVAHATTDDSVFTSCWSALLKTASYTHIFDAWNIKTICRVKRGKQFRRNIFERKYSIEIFPIRNWRLSIGQSTTHTSFAFHAQTLLLPYFRRTQ